MAKARQSWLMRQHKLFEKYTAILLVGILVMVAIGGIIEIVPLFYLKNTIEQVQGVRPYTPLELAGQKIYVREGCNVCHSQMVRPLRDEVDRYGSGPLHVGDIWTGRVGAALLWIAAALTMITGWDYFRKSLPFLKEPA